MNLNLLLIGIVPLARALLGWLENALGDGKIDLPEWKKFGETLVRMGVPMIALVWGLSISPEVAAGLIVLFDIVIVKLYNSFRKKK